MTAPTTGIGCNNDVDNLTAQGATIAGALTTNDCFGSGNQYRNDGYSIWMVSGRDYPMTVDAQSGMRDRGDA